MQDKIIERIVAESGVPQILEVLAERLSPADLQSLLLEVANRRAGALTPAAVLRQYENNRFVKPCAVDAEALHAFDTLAYAVMAPAFEIIDLAPVSPLGSCSVLATVDQHKVVSTVRNSEVCSDSTNVLALEYACRQRQSKERNPLAVTRLCASHRVLRAQVFEHPGMASHFRLLSLCSAGRDRGSFIFETDTLCEHIDAYLRLFDEARQANFEFGEVEVRMTAFDATRYAALEQRVFKPLTDRHSTTRFTFDQARTQGSGYYASVGFQIFITDKCGEPVMIGDGGFTDWTQKLLTNRKERCLISGIGSERFVGCFKPGKGE